MDTAARFLLQLENRVIQSFSQRKNQFSAACEFRLILHEIVCILLLLLNDISQNVQWSLLSYF